MISVDTHIGHASDGQILESVLVQFFHSGFQIGRRLEFNEPRKGQQVLLMYATRLTPSHRVRVQSPSIPHRDRSGGQSLSDPAEPSESKSMHKMFSRAWKWPGFQGR